MSYATMLHPQLIGIVGLLAIVACWSLAFALFRVGVSGSTARKVSALLVIEGFVLVTAGFPELASGLSIDFWKDYYAAHPSVRVLSGIVHHLSDAAIIALYPPFLALALDTRLARPFAGGVIRWIFTAAVFSLAIAVITLRSPPLIMAFYATITAVFLYALVVSVHAWQTADRGLTRERAGIFALAFGIRDLLWGVSYGIAAWVVWTGTDPWVMTDIRAFGKLIYGLGTLLAVPLIAYGVLRTHLFDIDLKVRWTIKQSTLAALVVACVFLLSEAADRFLSAELGSVAGLLAAAVVVFFLAPLQRFADSIAGSAMPNTQNTPEYAMFRKMQVYEEAVLDAQRDGGISDKERALLIRLRDSLGITESDASSIEDGTESA